MWLRLFCFGLPSVPMGIMLLAFPAALWRWANCPLTRCNTNMAIPWSRWFWLCLPKRLRGLLKISVQLGLDRFANLANALLGANEAFPNCAIEDFESSRVFPAGLISSAIMSIFVLPQHYRAMPLGIHVNQRILICGQRKYKLLAPVPASTSAAQMLVLLEQRAPLNSLQNCAEANNWTGSN